MNENANVNINDVIQIARKAGQEILNIYYSDEDKWEMKFKEDLSPLTQADQKSNEVICGELKNLYPEIPVITEENKEIPYDTRKTFDYFWLIDPLDGTKEFIKRNDEFTVNIALIKKEEVVLGVVYVPVTEKIYYAEKAKGAFYYDGSKNNIKLKVRTFGMKDKGLIVVASRSHMNQETQAFIKDLNEPGITSMGSSLKMILVAEGKAHLYPRLGPTMEWDTAAAQIIVEEAGGKVMNYNLRKPLKYNKQSLLNDYFLVTGKIQMDQ